jgi:hypothetical protein
MEKGYLELKNGSIFIRSDLRDKLIDAHNELVFLYEEALKGKLISANTSCPLCEAVHCNCDKCSYSIYIDASFATFPCVNYWTERRVLGTLANVHKLTPEQIQMKIDFHKEMIVRLQNAKILPDNES